MKKRFAMLLALLLAMCLIPVQSVLAANPGDTVNFTMNHYAKEGGSGAIYNIPSSGGLTYVDPYDGQYHVRMWADIEVYSGTGGIVGYCIEQSTPFSNGNRTAVSNVNSDAYNSLSAPAQEGIMLAMLYGYPSRTATTLGAPHADDAYVATQAIIWEYEMGFRTDAGSRIGSITQNGHTYSGNQIYNSVIAETPAAAVYNKILADIVTHQKPPSFTGAIAPTAPLTTLAYNTGTGKYQATVTDSNTSGADLAVTGTNTAGIAITRSGNSYTITANSPVSGTYGIQLRRANSPAVATGSFLIWGNTANSNQLIASGASDPVTNYMRVQMEVGGSLKVKKTSEDNIVAGIRFTISGPGGTRTVTTAANGEIQTDNLVPGSYTVTEEAIDRYVTQESKAVTVTAGGTATVTFHNVLKRGTAKIVKTSEDNVVTGIRFTITGTGVNQTVTTGTDGSIEIPNLLPGTYTVTEEVAGKYEPQNSQTVTVVGGRTSTVTFNNVLKRGNLRVTKTSEDNLVAGMRFHLYGTSLSGLAVDEYAVTNASGIATFEDVLISGETSYTLEEVDTAIRYVVPASQTASIAWNEVTGKAFHNVLKKWRVTATKTDTEKITAQGDATLSGAVYGVYKDNVLLDSYTTDQDGKFTTNYYICGSGYTVREIIPSTGYLLDETAYTVGAEPGNFTVELNPLTMGVTEQVIKGDIAIIKHMDDGETQLETPEPGAEFQVYLKTAGSYDAAAESERDFLITDTDGYAQTKKLPYGIYTAKQTKAAGTELMTPFDVFISEDGKTYRYIINNAVFKALIEIVKKDAETGVIIPVSGTGFKVKDLTSGEWIVQHVNYPTPVDIDTFYTDSSGKLMLPEKLPYGDYALYEVQASEGYALSENPVSFTVDGSVTTITVEMRNTPQKGRISVTKTGDVPTGATLTGLTPDNASGLTIQYETRGLEGVVYHVIAAEDIYTPDGTLRFSKGDIAASVTTDETGVAVSSPLYLGAYIVREYQAAIGYLLDSTEYPITLTYAGQEIEILDTVNLDIFNERQKARIDILKELEIDSVTGAGTLGEYKNVRFGLFAGEDILGSEGEILIPGGTLLQTTGIEADGKASFLVDILGEYYVKEIAADNKYLLSDLAYPVTFEYTDQTIETVILSVNDGKAILNKLKRGGVEITKSDVTDGALLPDTGIEILDSRGRVILQGRTDENGVVRFDLLPMGDYFFREVDAPEGYELDETPYAFSITEDGEIVKASMTNKPIVGTIVPGKDPEDPGVTDVPEAGLETEGFPVVLLFLLMGATLLAFKKKKGGANG